MPNVIIGIHGLGNEPPKEMLESWWKLAMEEGLRSGNFSADLPLFEMVYWADILHEEPLDIAEDDSSSPFYIDEEYVTANEPIPPEDHSKRRKVIDFLGKQMNRIFLNEDLTLNYSFITDTIIRRYFGDLEQYYSESGIGSGSNGKRVNLSIRERLRDKLLEHKKDNIMLISHSMGTIIAFDVLTFMIPEIRVHTWITLGSPLGLPVVISRIAAEQKQGSQKHTRLVTPPGVYKNWFNFSDILDKVAFNYQLSPYYSVNKFGVKPVDFLVVNNYKINGVRNPHKSFGYLRTHEFSNVLDAFIKTEKITAVRKLMMIIVQYTKKLRLWMEDKMKSD
jgi:hypothetical protein